MNKEYHELVNEIKILNNEIEKLSKNLFPIKHFINENGAYFKNEDSIKALSIIQEDINKMEIVLNEKKTQRDKISERLTQNCNHPIIINTVCPLCAERFYQAPETTSIILEIPNVSNYEIANALFTNEDQENNNEKIIEIINLAIQQEDTLLYFKNAIEEIQYDKNVKIRRLKR